MTYEHSIYTSFYTVSMYKYTHFMFSYIYSILAVNNMLTLKNNSIKWNQLYFLPHVIISWWKTIANHNINISCFVWYQEVRNHIKRFVFIPYIGFTLFSLFPKNLMSSLQGLNTEPLQVLVSFQRKTKDQGLSLSEDFKYSI